VGQIFKLLISTDIAMQRCILGNIFDNHLKYLFLADIGKKYYICQQIKNYKKLFEFYFGII